MGIGHLIEQCPQALLGRFVVVTSFDSGPLTLNESERAMGWSMNNELAYTTRVSSVETLPYDNFDEWYVFKDPVQLANCEVFVTGGGFTFEDPPPADPTWDISLAQENAERLTGVQTRFWDQLNSFNPESYIAEGGLFLFASANQELFTAVASAFKDYA